MCRTIGIPAAGSAWTITTGMASSARLASKQPAQSERIGHCAETVRQDKVSAPTAPTGPGMQLISAVVISATPAIIPATTAFSGEKMLAFAATYHYALKACTEGLVHPVQMHSAYRAQTPNLRIPFTQKCATLSFPLPRPPLLITANFSRLGSAWKATTK